MCSQHYGWKSLPEQSPRPYHNCFLKGSEAEQCLKPIEVCLETLSLVALGIKIGSKQLRHSAENGLEEVQLPLPALVKFAYLPFSQHTPFTHSSQQMAETLKKWLRKIMFVQKIYHQLKTLRSLAILCLRKELEDILHMTQTLSIPAPKFSPKIHLKQQVVLDLC